jgi:hypothetical protein
MDESNLKELFLQSVSEEKFDDANSYLNKLKELKELKQLKDKFCLKDIINDKNILDHYLKYIINSNSKSKSLKELITLCCNICPELKINYEKNYKFMKKNFKNTDKGNLGKIIESFLFGIEQNSDNNPDLKELGIDIKTSNFKQLKNNNYNAKERLTITNCGKKNEPSSFKKITENFIESPLYKKIKKSLIFIFHHNMNEKYENFENIMNKELLCIIDFNYEELEDEIKCQILKDYDNIKERIKNNNVSQSGQQFLHIHKHGSKGSENCALGFTNKFLTLIVGKNLEKKYGSLLIKKKRGYEIKL